jgi:hypothetical protein
MSFLLPALFSKDCARMREFWGILAFLRAGTGIDFLGQISASGRGIPAFF